MVEALVVIAVSSFVFSGNCQFAPYTSKDTVTITERNATRLVEIFRSCLLVLLVVMVDVEIGVDGVGAVAE